MDNFKRSSASGTGSLATMFTVPKSNLNVTPIVNPATIIIRSVVISNNTGGAVTANFVIKDVSASNLEISFIQESVNDGETKRFSCHEVLEEEDLVRISGNGLKFSFSYLEMS